MTVPHPVPTVVLHQLPTTAVTKKTMDGLVHLRATKEEQRVRTVAAVVGPLTCTPVTEADFEHGRASLSWPWP